MTNAWASPALQQAESAKYVPAQHVVVPTCDGLALFRCHGASRELIAIFEQPDDLSGYFVSHFTESQATSRAEDALQAARRSDPLANLGDISLDLSL